MIQSDQAVQPTGDRGLHLPDAQTDDVARGQSRPTGAHTDALATRPRRIAVIVNPTTHGNAPAIITLLRRHAPPDVVLDVRPTPAAGTATAVARAAVADGAQVAVAVGGDGTVAEVATAVQNTGIPLGVIPGGSTNITARSLGIPTEPAAAVALLFGPQRTVPIDVGCCGDRRFLHMAGTGFDSRIFAEANPARKRQFGWLAYLPPALHDLRLPPARFTVVADGTTHEVNASLVLVCNGGTIISPHLTLYPGIRTDDRQFDVLIFAPHGARALAGTLARLVTYGLEHSPYVTHLRAQHVEIQSDPILPVELDGDVVLQTPLCVDLMPATLRVIVPVPNGDQLRVEPGV